MTAKSDVILVLNAGSSSMKFAVYAAGVGEPVSVGHGQVEGIGSQPRFAARLTAPGAQAHPSGDVQLADGHAGALSLILAWLDANGLGPGRIAAVGHRIVHGGALATRPMRIGPSNLDALDALTALAPLHNAFGLGAIRVVAAAMPDAPQVACFDTAFHATQPEVATRLPLPQSYHDEGYRRYGFHGLNYEHVTAALPLASGKPLPERLLVLHLGNGCSACAIRGGASVATTMGYSTLDGLIMGTRSGSIDPGVLIALLRDKNLRLEALEDLLYRQSGLRGLSGGTSDMRDLLATDDPACRRAVDHFCYAAAQHSASLLVALGGLDAVVFTGGIGANAPEVRARIIEHLAWLGLELDAAANARHAPRISAASSRIEAWIIPADEERAIARRVMAILGA